MQLVSFRDRLAQGLAIDPLQVPILSLLDAQEMTIAQLVASVDPSAAASVSASSAAPAHHAAALASVGGTRSSAATAAIMVPPTSVCR